MKPEMPHISMWIMKKGETKTFGNVPDSAGIMLACAPAFDVAFPSLRIGFPIPGIPSSGPSPGGIVRGGMVIGMGAKPRGSGHGRSHK